MRYAVKLKAEVDAHSLIAPSLLVHPRWRQRDKASCGVEFPYAALRFVIASVQLLRSALIHSIPHCISVSHACPCRGESCPRHDLRGCRMRRATMGTMYRWLTQMRDASLWQSRVEIWARVWHSLAVWVVEGCWPGAALAPREASLQGPSVLPPHPERDIVSHISCATSARGHCDISWNGFFDGEHIANLLAIITGKRIVDGCLKSYLECKERFIGTEFTLASFIQNPGLPV